MLVACVAPAMAQSVGEIAGEVKDTSGAAIADVRLVATNIDTNVSR